VRRALVVRDKHGMDPRDKLELTEFGYDYALQHENSDTLGAWMRQMHYLDDEQLPNDKDIWEYATGYVDSLIDASDDSDFEMLLKPFDHTNQYQAARQAIVAGVASRTKKLIDSQTLEWWVKNYGD
jgi:hypothetical protein